MKIGLILSAQWQFSAKRQKGCPVTLNFGEKIPESREKLPGFSNPKNLRTFFSE
jgi:hypothetical protein